LAENLVIVESPAKAKTIEKYLGKKYKVILKEKFADGAYVYNISQD